MPTLSVRITINPKRIGGSKNQYVIFVNLKARAVSFKIIIYQSILSYFLVYKSTIVFQAKNNNIF